MLYLTEPEPAKSETPSENHVEGTEKLPVDSNETAVVTNGIDDPKSPQPARKQGNTLDTIS